MGSCADGVCYEQRIVINVMTDQQGWRHSTSTHAASAWLGHPYRHAGEAGGGGQLCWRGILSQELKVSKGGGIV
jgi:hypothetical protein